MYTLIKHICEYIICIKDHTIAHTYKPLYKLLLTDSLLILEYKSFASYYTIFILNNNQESDIIDLK